MTTNGLDARAQTRGVQLKFIRPGKPVDNAYIESFNSRVRDECLHQHWFLNLNDARPERTGEGRSSVAEADDRRRA